MAASIAAAAATSIFATCVIFFGRDYVADWHLKQREANDERATRSATNLVVHASCAVAYAAAGAACLIHGPHATTTTVTTTAVQLPAAFAYLPATAWCLVEIYDWLQHADIFSVRKMITASGHHGIVYGIHHFVTLALLALSHKARLHAWGAALLCLHGPVDVMVDVYKLRRIVPNRIILPALFVVFVATRIFGLAYFIVIPAWTLQDINATPQALGVMRWSLLVLWGLQAIWLVGTFRRVVKECGGEDTTKRRTG